MGANKDIHPAGGNIFQGSPLLPQAAETVYHIHLGTEIPQPVGKGLIMLLGKNRGRHQHRHLLASHNSLKGRPDGHLSFAKAYIPTEKAIHRLLPFHIPLYFLDSRQLICRFLKRKGILKFLLPYRISPKGKALGFFPLGIKLHQLLGNILHSSLSLCLGLGPCRAAHTVKPWNFALGANVFLQHAHLVRRHIELIIPTVLDAKVIPSDALDFHGFHAQVLADAMLVMDHIVTNIDFPEMADPLLAANTIQPLFLAAKDILFRNEHQIGSRQLKAVQQCSLDNIDPASLQFLCRIRFNGSQTIPPQQLLQGGRLLPISYHHQDAAVFSQPVPHLGHKDVHLLLIRGYSLQLDADYPVRLDAVEIGQNHGQKQHIMSLCLLDQIIPGKHPALDFWIFL